MKKGEIYEAIVEKVEFPNKGIVQCRRGKSDREKCHSWTENTVCDQ